MVQERIYVDISQETELRELVEQMTASGTPAVLQIDHEDVALLTPAKPPKRRGRGILTREDPLFQMIGAGRSDIPGGVSEHKHDALLRAERDQQ